MLAKPTFRAAAVRRRALVPADGYYEWQVRRREKIPTFPQPGDGRAAAFAGLTWPK